MFLRERYGEKVCWLDVSAIVGGPNSTVAPASDTHCCNPIRLIEIPNNELQIYFQREREGQPYVRRDGLPAPHLPLWNCRYLHFLQKCRVVWKSHKMWNSFIIDKLSVFWACTKCKAVLYQKCKFFAPKTLPSWMTFGPWKILKEKLKKNIMLKIKRYGHDTSLFRLCRLFVMFSKVDIYLRACRCSFSKLSMGFNLTTWVEIMEKGCHEATGLAYGRKKDEQITLFWKQQPNHIQAILTCFLSQNLANYPREDISYRKDEHLAYSFCHPTKNDIHCEN